MPKSRAAKAPNLPVRESPRKRKREEPILNGTKPENAAEPVTKVEQPPPTKGSQRGRKKQPVADPVQKSHLKATETTEEPAIATKIKEVSTKTVLQSKRGHKTDSSKGEIEPAQTEAVPKKSGKKVDEQQPRKTKAGEDIKAEDEDTSENKPKKKRKTKEEKEAEAMPLAARTIGLKMFVGAHVSIAKGLENAVTNSLHIGGNAFALFLKSQRKWENPPLKDENRDAFRHQCSEHKFDSMSHVVPHGSYLVNLATPDKDKAKQSYDAFIDDLRRCEKLGIKYYNFHPGATNQEPLNEAIERLAGNLNKALSETSTVVPLLENMAGSAIGSRFTDLRDIISLIKPEYKSRIGICIDTCHTFAAGYDLRTPEAYKKTFDELDEIVGLKYLKAMHINDSKAPLSSKRDLHQNIGAGFLGLRAFHNVMNDRRLENIPLVLETPCDKPDPSDPSGKKTIDDKNVWAREIKLLESLIGMDPESEEFQTLEKELSKQGQAEREKMTAAINLKDAKAAKKMEKGQKSIANMLGTKGNAGKTKRKNSAGSTSSLSDVEGSE